MILCGGGGERLWPLSRKNKPKQFITFLDDRSFLEQTIDRINLLTNSVKNIGVVTNQSQVDFVKKLVGEKVGLILAEPASRNTAPAILYSCFELEKIDKDAIVVFLPADSFVVQEDKYREYLSKAIEYASENEKIVTLGVMPTRSVTGYGYIQAVSLDEANISCGNIYNVETFHEKPNEENAKKYMQQGDMFWNIGVFVGRVSVFLNEYKKHASALFYSVQSYLQDKIEYEALENISVDYAVMEKTKNVVILPCDFEWDDIGNLDAFLSVQNKYSKTQSAKIINIDAQGNLVKLKNDSSLKNKIVTFIGVNDICLVEDEDVILVAKRSEIEKVKKLLAEFRKEKLDKFL